MSIMCCVVCGDLIDTDLDVECFGVDDEARCVLHRDSAEETSNEDD